MDALRLHLLLNHVPVVGTIGALLLLAAGLLRRSRDITMAALVALVLTGLVAVPVFMTGSSAEQNIVGRTDQIQHHKDAAVAALVSLESSAAVALCAVLVCIATRRFPMFAAVAALILGIAAAVLVVRASALGAEIRHTELTSNASAVTNDP